MTASYPGGTGGFNGFYMQTPGANTPDASDAIFVYAGGGSFTAPAVGDFVEVVGTAGEAFGVTQITPGSTGSVTQLTAAHDPVAPLTKLPGSDCAVGSLPDGQRSSPPPARRTRARSSTSTAPTRSATPTA